MKFLEQHPHWPQVIEVFKTLSSQGYQAWLAGGCVRDSLLKREPTDFDFATNARPNVVEKLFQRSITVGKQFGVIIVPYDGFQIEITTFRKDGPYLDGRRPQDVVFCTPEEDAARRDFTINALFYDLREDKVLDFVGGQKDLQQGLIRTVGVAEERFDEDKLRLLRAVRFAAQLDFRIETQTWAAVQKMAPQITHISVERIRDELGKLMKSPGRVWGLKLLDQAGFVEILLPQLVSTYARTLSLLEPIQASAISPEAAWSLLFLNWAKSQQPSLNLKEAAKPFEQLKFSTHFVRQVANTLCEVPRLARQSDWRKSQLAKFLAQPYADTMLEVYKWDSQFELGDLRSYQWYNGWREKLLVDGKKLPPPFISGNDLRKLGVLPGPGMGRLLSAVFDLQLEGELNSKQEALEWIRQNNS